MIISADNDAEIQNDMKHFVRFLIVLASDFLSQHGLMKLSS